MTEQPAREPKKHRKIVLVVVSAVLATVAFLSDLTNIINGASTAVHSAVAFVKHVHLPWMHQSAVRYCYKVQSDGKNDDYYTTKPGTDVAANEDILWVTSIHSEVGNSENDYNKLQDWWTPGFRFWEQLNVADNFTPPGSTATYARFQYVLVLPDGNQPNWEPLGQFLATHPSDTTAEVEERQLFITEGLPNLNVAECAS